MVTKAHVYLEVGASLGGWKEDLSRSVNREELMGWYCMCYYVGRLASLTRSATLIPRSLVESIAHQATATTVYLIDVHSSDGGGYYEAWTFPNQQQHEQPDSTSE